MVRQGQADRRCVYGPVPSRRLGRSLGVDLVPFKTCTYDCTYCQLGRTTDQTVERREYVSIAAILTEVEQRLAAGDAPDYISLAGSGEPTLQCGLDRLIEGIKGVTDIPVAVITNGSLLWKEQVRAELLSADLVLPSLDAGDSEMFMRVNRPHPSLGFDLMLEGLTSFTRSFEGQVWLEVMLLAGLTDTPHEVEKLATLVGHIAPARTQLNTASRPTAEQSARAVPADRIPELAQLFPGEVDVICDFADHDRAPRATVEATDAAIVALLQRRPCTADDIATGLGLHVLDVFKHLDILLAKGRVRLVAMDASSFYTLADAEDRGAP